MQDDPGRDDVWRLMYVARDADEVVRRYLQRLRRIRDEGFEVHVLAGPGAGIEELNRNGIHARSIPVHHVHNPAGLLGAYFIVQAQLLELRPVLVHLLGHRVAWMGAFAARQAEVPTLFATMEFHWLDEEPVRIPLGPLGWATGQMPGMVRRAEETVNETVGGPYRRLMRQAYRWLGDQVDRYLVTTEFDFQLAQDLELADNDKLEIIIGGSGVDLDEYSLPEQGRIDRQGARQRLELPRHWRQVVGWVGPVTRRHGADELIAAISKLRLTHPSVGWLIIPRGELAAGQARRLRRLQDRGRVRLLEQAESGADLFLAMDVLAWLGRASTPHDAIGEAAAMAVPTVGYDTPGARSMVEQAQTGHLVFEGDRQGAVSTLAKVLDDPRYLQELGRRARARVSLRFSRQAVDDQVLRLYDQVVQQSLQSSKSK